VKKQLSHFIVFETYLLGHAWKKNQPYLNRLKLYLINYKIVIINIDILIINIRVVILD